MAVAVKGHLRVGMPHEAGYSVRRCPLRQHAGAEEVTDIVADDVVTDSGAAAGVSECFVKALYGPAIVFHEEVGLPLGLPFAEFIQELSPNRDTAPGLCLRCENPNTFVLPVHTFPLEDQQFTQAGSHAEVHGDFDDPFDVRGGCVMNLLEVFRSQGQLFGKLIGLLPFAERILGEVLVLHAPVEHYFQVAEVAVSSCGRVVFVPAVDELDERHLFQFFHRHVADVRQDMIVENAGPIFQTASASCGLAIPVPKVCEFIGVDSDIFSDACLKLFIA